MVQDQSNPNESGQESFPPGGTINETSIFGLRKIGIIRLWRENGHKQFGFESDANRKRTECRRTRRPAQDELKDASDDVVISLESTQLK